MKKKRRETNVPQVERNFRFSGVERRQKSVAVLLKFWTRGETLVEARELGTLNIPGIRSGPCTHPVRMAHGSLALKYPNFKKLVGYIVRYDLDKNGPYLVRTKGFYVGKKDGWVDIPVIKTSLYSRKWAYVCFLPDEWVGKRVRRTVTHHVLDTGEQVRVA